MIILITEWYRTLGVFFFFLGGGRSVRWFYVFENPKRQDLRVTDNPRVKRSRGPVNCAFYFFLRFDMIFLLGFPKGRSGRSS